MRGGGGGGRGGRAEGGRWAREGRVGEGERTHTEGKREETGLKMFLDFNFTARSAELIIARESRARYCCTPRQTTARGEFLFA